MKEDIKQILRERIEVLQKIDEAYDKILNPGTRDEGLQALENLRGKDDAVLCIIGHAHELAFYEGERNPQEAEQAIKAYQEAIKRGHYDFLKEDIARIAKDAGLCIYKGECPSLS